MKKETVSKKETEYFDMSNSSTYGWQHFEKVTSKKN